MATITKLQRKRGVVYRAQIRIKRDGKLIHSEAKTFGRKALAVDWAAKRELELQDPDVLARARHGALTVGEVLKRYLTATAESAGRTKRTTLEMLTRQDLAERDALKLTTGQLIDHAHARQATAGPATILQDFIWLRVAFQYARRTWKLPLDLQVIEDAMASLRETRVIAKSQERDRRVSDDEIKQVIGQLSRMRTSYPMADIIWFAVHSARRQSEITGLLWADLDDATRTGLIRDLKHPTRKEGNHKRCKFTPEAWEIIQRQPRTGDRVFPYNAKTISTYFTRAVNILELPDLHFHDLRHEATSRLFERGYSIQEVQQFTLHESWQMLSRYTHLRPEDVPDRPIRQLEEVEE